MRFFIKKRKWLAWLLIFALIIPLILSITVKAVEYNGDNIARIDNSDFVILPFVEEGTANKNLNLKTIEDFNNAAGYYCLFQADNCRGTNKPSSVGKNGGIYVYLNITANEDKLYIVTGTEDKTQKIFSTTDSSAICSILMYARDGRAIIGMTESDFNDLKSNVVNSTGTTIGSVITGGISGALSSAAIGVAKNFINNATASGFTTEAPLASENSYRIWSSIVLEAIKDDNIDKDICTFLTKLIGLYDQNFGKVVTSTKTVGNKTFRFVKDCILVPESRGLYPALIIKDNLLQLQESDGNLIDITNKISGTYHTLADSGDNKYKSILDYLDASAQATIDFDNANTASGASGNDFDSAYDYYAAKLILAHTASSSTSNEAAEANQILQNFPSAVSVNGTNQFMTEEEKLRLQVFHDILNNIKSYNKLDISPLTWNNKTGLSDISINGTSTWSAIDLKEQSDDLVDGRYSEYSEVATATQELAVTNCLAIAKYYASIAYGLIPDSAASTDYTTIRQSSFIESVTLTKDNADITSMNLNFKDESTGKFRGIPAMKRIGEIKGTTESRDAYYNLNLLLLAIADWANEHADEYAEWYTTLKGCSVNDVANGSDRDASDILHNNISAIKAAVNISDTLEFLGVDKNWFPNIAKVCQYANDLRPFAELVYNMDISYEANEEEPMKTFFNISNGTFADDYLTGVALSATYKPMYTNLYDVNSVSFVEDTDWVTRFHYPWGFYRKALYIDTNMNAAVENYVKSSTKGTVRLATLKDLLEPEKDIVLYLDDKFYNVDELAEAQNMTYNKVQNTEDTVKEESTEEAGTAVINGMASLVKQAIDFDVESIVKTGGNKTYSKSIYDNVSHVNDSSNITDIADSYLLSLDDIDYQLKGYSNKANDDYAKQYTPMQSYAVVSSIYRHTSLYKIVNKLANNNPAVFVSSPSLYAMNNVPMSQFNSIYNYVMLKNLKDVLPIDYKSQLDLSEALYMDIYGNIITDSGLVVIPAMANATLCGSNYNPMTVGFMYLYNSGSYKIPGNANNCADMLCDAFSLDENTNEFMLRKKIINGIQINLNTVQLNDEGIIKIMYEAAIDNCYMTDFLPFNNHVYMITEVLRGAPLEYVDKDKEMINTSTSYSKVGVWIANKLDEIIDAFYSKENRIKILSLPNLAFMSGFEYVILYIYKIMFVALFVLLIYRIYIDAINGSLGIKSLMSFVMSVVMFLVTAFAVPYVLDLSYYQVNKSVLQSETMQAIMLDAEKKAEGREIGLTGVQSVNNDSTFYLKVDDLSVPWYAILDDVLLSNVNHTLNEVYEDELSHSPLANLPRFTRQGQNLYIDVDDVLDNSVMLYDDVNKVISSVVADTPYESYITPYYAVLDGLIAKINNYNVKNSINSYDTKVMAGGQVKTLGLIKPYLTSEEFMSTSQDVSGFKQIYGVDSTLYEFEAFSQDDIDLMSKSYWYKDPYMFADDEKFADNLDKIDAEARHFVAEHKELLGKISDESFLEVMALDIACKHNNIFKIGNACAIENYDMDTTDIIRLSLASKSTVISQCSKSFSRFIYDNSGVLGILTSAFLLFTYIISAVVKPICLGIIIFCLVAAVVVRRLIKKDNRASIEGYLLTMAIMCVVNVLFALVFKLSMYLPNLGLSLSASALAQIALQVLYILAIVKLTEIVISDWKNAGFEKYVKMAGKLSGVFKSARINARKQDTRAEYVNIHSDVAYSDDQQRAKRNRRKEQYSTKMDRRNGNTILDSMKDNDAERRRNARRR